MLATRPWLLMQGSLICSYLALCTLVNEQCVWLRLGQTMSLYYQSLFLWCLELLSTWRENNRSLWWKKSKKVKKKTKDLLGWLWPRTFDAWRACRCRSLLLHRRMLIQLIKIWEVICHIYHLLLVQRLGCSFLKTVPAWWISLFSSPTSLLACLLCTVLKV